MKVSKVTGYLLCGMILAAGILFFVENDALAEDVTITTYYPVPYGVYNQLVTQTFGVGDNDGDGGLDSDDAPDPATNPGDVWIDGNVGIGTISPSYKLDVDGDINTTGDVRKNGTAYDNPDYVFQPGYKLLPLGELKKFVAKKRHLPNMPSTQEIRKEGVKIFE